MKGVYFISDAHLGSWAISHRRMQERRLVRFLDDIKDKAQAVYMLGDMFDYWYEYKYVVPKGYTRFLGKISELTDSGVEVHYFIGNHDIWMFGCTRNRSPLRLWVRSFFWLTVTEWVIPAVLSGCCARYSGTDSASSCSLSFPPAGVCGWVSAGPRKVWRTIA